MRTPRIYDTMAEARRGTTTRHGFTLLEMVVTVALTATVLTVLLPWVLNLVFTSSQNITQAASTRASANIGRTLRADFARAVACPATRTALNAATPTDLAFYTTSTLNDPSDDSQVFLVIWHLADGQLVRTAAPAHLSGECTATGAAGVPTVFPGAVTVTAGTDGQGGHAFTGTPSLEVRSLLVDLTVTLPDGGQAQVLETFSVPVIRDGLL